VADTDEHGQDADAQLNEENDDVTIIKNLYAFQCKGDKKGKRKRNKCRRLSRPSGSLCRSLLTFFVWDLCGSPLANFADKFFMVSLFLKC